MTRVHERERKMTTLGKALRSPLAPAVILGGLVLWSLWPVLTSMAQRWSTDPRYNHGYLVPFFSLALLWLRRDLILKASFRPTTWGLALIATGAGCQLLGGYYRFQPIEGAALPFYLAGAAIVVGGWQALNWSWPSILFLVFMIPLPFRIEKALGPPLQWLATIVSTFTLQTLGFMAFSEGNVIQLNDYKIGVVEACSGLSMLITFVALSTGIAMVIKRPLIDKIVLILSSIPVALVANIARITLTGILHETMGKNVASHFYHDLAGWLMIPFALILYWCVIWIFSNILVEVEQVPLLVGVPAAPPLLGDEIPKQKAPKPGTRTARPRRTR
jgi:exosortase